MHDSINDRIKKGEKMDESIKDEIRALLNDLESDRIERTISTTNTDKFGQAICAFANDLPNHQMPGFLFLGVLDNGEIQGVDVTDELLKNVAAIRTDGNIQPQPTMTVEKVVHDMSTMYQLLMVYLPKDDITFICGSNEVVIIYTPDLL